MERQLTNHLTLTAKFNKEKITKDSHHEKDCLRGRSLA